MCLDVCIRTECAWTHGKIKLKKMMAMNQWDVSLLGLGFLSFAERTPGAVLSILGITQ
jgi:hypothetical protein